MQKTSKLDSVRTGGTRGGNTRYSVCDAEGNEYTTFRPQIGERAKELEGTNVRILPHEEQRDRFTNVLLDAVEPAAPAAPAIGDDTDPQEAAWRSAVEAAPWLVGEPGEEVSPDELPEKLKPFEERVAEDIEKTRSSVSARSSG